MHTQFALCFGHNWGNLVIKQCGKRSWNVLQWWNCMKIHLYAWNEWIFNQVMPSHEVFLMVFFKLSVYYLLLKLNVLNWISPIMFMAIVKSMHLSISTFSHFVGLWHNIEYNMSIFDEQSIFITRFFIIICVNTGLCISSIPS